MSHQPLLTTLHSLNNQHDRVGLSVLWQVEAGRRYQSHSFLPSAIQLPGLDERMMTTFDVEAAGDDHIHDTWIPTATHLPSK